MNDTVLITGGSGFIGSHCLTPLVEHGARVVSVGRRPVDVDGVEYIECDLLDDSELRNVVEVVSASRLLHLAWFLEPGKYADSLANLDWLAASLGLVRRFADSGGERVVAAGTCFEYAWDTPILREDSAVAPSTLYGRSKNLLHEALKAYGGAGGPSYAWARLFFLYGPGEDRRRLAGAVAAALIEGQDVDTSEGTQRRDYMFVADVGRALAALSLSDVGGAVNVATGSALAVGDLIGRIADETGRSDLIHYGARPMPAHEPPLIQADVSRLRDEVGFDVYTPVGQAVAETVNWWREELGVT